MNYDVSPKDGFISPEGFENYLRTKRKSALSFDIDGDFTISESELVAMNAALAGERDALRRKLEVFVVEYAGGMPVKNFAISYRMKEASNFAFGIDFGRIVARDTPEYPGLFEGYKDAKEAKGMSLQFNRDMNKGESVMNLKGAIMAAFLSEDESSSIPPSLEFIRIRNRGDHTKDTDTLNFRVAFEKGFTGPKRSHYLSMRPMWAPTRTLTPKSPDSSSSISPFLPDGASVPTFRYLMERSPCDGRPCSITNTATSRGQATT